MLGALIGTTALGAVQTSLGVADDPSIYGACIIAYLTSIPLFYIAGLNYKQFKEENPWWII